MKNSKFLLTLILSIVCFLPSCKDAEDGIVDNNLNKEISPTQIAYGNNEISTIEEVNSQNSLIEKLKQSVLTEEKENFDRLNWEDSKLVTYSNSDNPIIHIPFLDNPSNLLVASFNQTLNKFDKLIMKVEVDEKMFEDQQNYSDGGIAFSGKLIISTSTGEDLLINYIEQGIVTNKVKTELFINNTSSKSSSWTYCMVNCFWDNLYTLPNVVSVLCGGSCATCAVAAPACAVCAFCVSVNAGYCFGMC